MAVRAGYSCPKGYKQTEVGVIPEDWGVKRLGEIGEAIIGLTYSPKDVHSDGVLVLRSSNIQEDQLRFEDNVFVKMDIPEKLFVKSGDVLICVRNGSRDLIGKCAQINKKAEGMAFGAFMTIFRSPNNDFVYHQFQSDIIKKQIKSHLGATINQITNKSLNSFQVPLPPTLAEQEAIAAALSDADALIAALEGLIAKKRQIKQGAMQELLSGDSPLVDSGERKEVSLGDVAEIQMCKRIFAEQTSTNGDIPFYKIGTFGKKPDAYISKALFQEYKNKYSFPRKGDILLSAAGTLGRTVVYDGKPSYYQDSNIVWLDVDKNKISNEYLFHYYKIIKWASPEGSTISRLYNSIIRKTKIFLPPLAEQTAIAEILSDMDAEIEMLAAKLSKARQVKQGMMSELLTGRVRLI